MTCLENLIKKPVILQLGDPIAAAHSVEEASFDILDDEGNVTETVKCGKAGMSMKTGPVMTPQGPMMDPQTRQPAQQTQPVLVQILSGEIEAISDDGVMFSTLGGDNKTQVIVYIPRENIRAVTFAMEHVPQTEEPAKPDTSKIIQPN